MSERRHQSTREESQKTEKNIAVGEKERKAISSPGCRWGANQHHQKNTTYGKGEMGVKETTSILGRAVGYPKRKSKKMRGIAMGLLQI